MEGDNGLVEDRVERTVDIRTGANAWPGDGRTEVFSGSAGVFGRFRMQGEQGRRQVFAHEQAVNARIFEKFHGQALEGAQLSAICGRRPAAVVYHAPISGAAWSMPLMLRASYTSASACRAVVVGHDLPQCVISGLNRESKGLRSRQSAR